MKLMRSTSVIATAFAFLALSATQAAAQAPVVTWQQVGSGVRADWTAIPGASHYEAFVDGVQAPIPILTNYFQVSPVPLGTYVLQIRAAAGTVKGPLSAPVTIVMGSAPSVACGALSAPTVNVSTAGMLVNVNWNAVDGAAGYLLQVGATPGATDYQTQLPANQTTFSAPIPMAGTFYVRVVSGNACGNLTSSGDQPFTVGAATPGATPGVPSGGSGPRTADPAPGQRLPLPGYGASVVEALARAYGGDLQNSCTEHGGTNNFMFRVVQALRQQDSRWGLNWKRGNRGDLSQDIVTYNFGAGSDEDTTNVYIVDIIGGHCGSRAYPTWIDQTTATRNAGTIGRWTLQPYIARGWPADSRQ
jgi:hypothetical protein